MNRTVTEFKKRSQLRLIFFVATLMSMISLSQGGVKSIELSLNEAQEIAVHRTSRGEIIKGKEEVAAQNYRARRINFLVPEVSINGSLPAYSVDESFRFFGGATQKRLFNTRDLSFRSFIELKQSLLTGGSLTATANLIADDSRYPDTRPSAVGSNVNEIAKRGFFNFSLEQPLFRPSATKKELYDRRDDMEIARIDRRTDEATLRSEVTDSYIGVLQFNLKLELQRDLLESARLKAEIDSSKFSDGVVSEETWLESSSERLDAELEMVNIETQASEEIRQLRTLLDLGPDEEIVSTEPSISDHFDKAGRERLRMNWQNTVAIERAEREYEKSRREARYASAGHGITGDLRANYSFGRENIEQEFSDKTLDDDISTRGWGVSLNVRLPVWDGGAGGAAVRAAEFQAEQARLEYEQAVREAEYEIIDLLNDLDVSYQRLSIIQRQIELSNNRLQIANTRYHDGQISRITYLESRTFNLQQRDRYLEELKTYLTNRIELDYKYVSL